MSNVTVSLLDGDSLIQTYVVQNGVGVYDATRQNIVRFYNVSGTGNITTKSQTIDAKQLEYVQIDPTEQAKIIATNLRYGVNLLGVDGGIRTTLLNEYLWVDNQVVTDFYIDVDAWDAFDDEYGIDFTSSFALLSYSDGTMTFNGQSIGYSNIGFSYLRALDFTSYATDAYVIAWCRDTNNPVFIYSNVVFESSVLGLKFATAGWLRNYVNFRDSNNTGVTIQLSQIWDRIFYYRDILFGIGIAGTVNFLPAISPVPGFSKNRRPSYLINSGDSPSDLYFNVQYNPTALFSKLLYNYTETIEIGGNNISINYCPLGFDYLVAVNLSSINNSLTGQYAIFWDTYPIYSTATVTSIGISTIGWQVSKLNITGYNVTVDYSKMHTEFLNILDEFVAKTKTTFGEDAHSDSGVTVSNNVLKFNDNSYVSGNVLHIASDATVVGNTLKLSGSSLVDEETIFEELNAYLWGSNS